VLDSGAIGALTLAGASLLPAGIADVRGEFARGDCVACIDQQGREFGRGLAAYDSDECRQIRGEASSRIDQILGYHDGDEVIHRDDLAILAELSDSDPAQVHEEV
jgi:glutamate 5-kinase